MIPAVFVLALAAAAGAVWALLRARNMEIWIGSYIRQSSRRREGLPKPAHVYFCFVDHYEPYWNHADREQARRRVETWCREYPRMAEAFRDAAGRWPQHNYFYPEEEYDPDLLDRIAAQCRQGLGDVEVHLHHDNDTADGLRGKIEGFKKTLHERHGLLRKDARTGRIEYAFIHGNWALDNSRPDGRWCGVNDEIAILKETGCYADFTLPSAPSDTQTRKINSIYFARGTPGRSKSHDDGKDARAGEWDDSGLLLVQGPLALNWKSRKLGLIPRIENAEISADNPPTRERVELWGRQAIRVEGRPDHVFIKVHTHGLQEDNLRAFFEGGLLQALYRDLTECYAREKGCELRFMTAREVYEKIRELCAAPEAAPARAGAR